MNHPRIFFVKDSIKVVTFPQVLTLPSEGGEGAGHPSGQTLAREGGWGSGL